MAFEDISLACINPYAALQTEDDVTQRQTYLFDYLGAPELSLTPNLLLVLVRNLYSKNIILSCSSPLVLMLELGGQSKFRG